MAEPTARDVRELREFREMLALPTPQQRRLALLKEMPESTDPADCVCDALNRCTATDNACPYCRTIERCTPEQKAESTGASHG